MAELESQRGQNEPVEKRVLGQIDPDDPNRIPLLNDKIASEIAKTLGRRLYRTKLSNGSFWEMRFPQGEHGFYSLTLQSYNKASNGNPLLDTPAYDEVSIQKNSRSKKEKGWNQATNNITGITCIEIEGNKVSFLQSLNSWRLSLSVSNGGQQEIQFTEYGELADKTEGSFSYRLNSMGHSYRALHF
jgi:hypothetical protein